MPSMTMFNYNKRIILFCVGFIIGSLLALHCRKLLNRNVHISSEASIVLSAALQNIKYNEWFERQDYYRNEFDIDIIRYGNMSHDKFEAQLLFDSISIVCIILSTNNVTVDGAIHTWTKGCNKMETIYLIGKKNRLQIKKTRDNSNWAQLSNFIKSFDISSFNWIIFVHDQTFVLLENLRLLLAPLKYSDAYYLGHARSFWGVNFNIAQAGYVLSQESYKILQNELQSNTVENAIVLGNKEDFMLGKALAKYNISPFDTRDEKGYSTFNAYNWQQEFFPGVNYYTDSLFPHKCCSSAVITFKGIERDKFYMYYYLLYQLYIFKTGSFGNKLPPVPKDKDYVWKRFLSEQGIFRNVTNEEYYEIWQKSGLDPKTFTNLKYDYD